MIGISMAQRLMKRLSEKHWFQSESLLSVIVPASE